MAPERRSPSEASSRRASYENGSYRVSSSMLHNPAHGKQERSLRFKSFLGVCSQCGDLPDQCTCPEAKARARRWAEEHQWWIERKRAGEGRG